MSWICQLFLHPCFVVCNRASRSRITPSPQCCPARRQGPIERTDICRLNTFPLKKTVISFPISQRIEKMILFVNKQSQGKSKKIISSEFESSPILRSGAKGLTILKSSLYEKFRVIKKRRKIYRPAQAFASREKIFRSPGEKASKIGLTPPENPTCIRSSGLRFGPSEKSYSLIVEKRSGFSRRRTGRNPAADFLRIYLPRYSPQPAPPPRARNCAPGARNAPWSARGRGQGASR